MSFRFTCLLHADLCLIGPIGLVTLLAARAAGAAPIIITDISESRLAFAKKLAPHVTTIAISKNLSAKEQAEVVKKEAGLALSVAIDCTGVESSIHTAI